MNAWRANAGVTACKTSFGSSSRGCAIHRRSQCRALQLRFRGAVWKAIVWEVKSTRSIRRRRCCYTVCFGHSQDHGDHSHSHHHHHEHEHEHGHCHSTQDSRDWNFVQRALITVADATGIAAVANSWRDSLQLCCVSIGLVFLAIFSPRLLPRARGLQTGLAIVAFSLTGVPAVLDACMDVAGGKVNIHVLMALAAFGSVFMGNALEGALLLAMFSLSHQAEEYFTNRALGDVKALKKSNPEFALVLDREVSSHSHLSTTVPYVEVDVSKVEVGALLLVKAGEGVPVDCQVWQGRSTVTVEHLTGEAHPLDKRVGDTIPGGARNLDGMLIVKATKTWEESTLARIMKLTEEAQANKPRLQRWLDEFGEKYSKAVVAMSVTVAALGPFVFKWPFLSTSGVRGSLYRGLGLMVAASPCALAVAPLAYATAISSCASKGILLKGGEVFDALAACDTVAFDKTGTLTTGELECKAIEPIHGHLGAGKANCCNPSCEVEALAVAAAMERGATHPIARAVVEHSEGKELPSIVIDTFESLPGQGLFATIANRKVLSGHKALIGSLDYIASSFPSMSSSQKVREAARLSIHGNDLVHAVLSIDEKVTLFHFEDKIRAGTAEVLRSLKEEAGLKLLMLTGDHPASAQRVANAVGIEEVHSDLRPEDKLLHVKKLARQRDEGNLGGLIMVGDGVNDAPALAAATVGIVLARFASATAVAVADVLLLKDAIDGVPFVISKARQTTSLVKQNVILAMASIVVAALSSVGGLLPLWITVLLHEGGTLLVCVNSVRALNEPLWSSQWRRDMVSFIQGLIGDRTRKEAAHVI
ncbi:hypothetical protein SELMODRAFT_167322 [Selaginella moellendorffii]|uniref:P-type ATPase A domain-containing protein n=1 Tax=Selaginella moellendorffii TaxID=88036 RepID=D8R2L0_SELML|nr:hypothetical protein SELMODRAFT_167322 [Selaginella moellendorffii]